MSTYMNDLLRLSNEYGSDERYVVKGGGNTSVKDGPIMYVKASGEPLSTIKKSGFVKMKLSTLETLFDKTYSPNQEVREKEVLQDLMDARVEGETMRPSVEALLHSLIPFRFVVHLHPAIVNGLTCSMSGKEGMQQLFKDALWIDIVNPGFILAKTVREAMNEYKEVHHNTPQIIFLQNHGVFVGSDTAEGIDQIYDKMMKTLEHSLIRRPNFTPVKVHQGEVDEVNTLLQHIFPTDNPWIFLMNHELVTYLKSEKNFYAISSSYTPDHIVYSSVGPLWVSEDVYKDKELLIQLIKDYKNKNKVAPKVIAFQNLGVFCMNESARTLFVDTIKVAVFCESFGGPRFMEQEYVDFIRDWEVENYRAKVPS